MPVASTKSSERLRRLAVEHAAAGDDHRTLGVADPLGSRLKRCRVRPVARDGPDALGEQLHREVVRFGLHILGQRKGDGAGVRRAGQHAHGFGQRGDDLVRPVDAVPVAADRLEAVVDADVLGMLGFELLQHRGHVAPGEDVAGQEQHRQAVDGGRGRAGDHVGGAGADGRGAREGAQPVVVLGISRRPYAPWPARCASGRSGSPGIVAAPGQCRRRCRGRRCQSSRRRTGVRSPSRDTYWLVRNLTIACAVVSRTVLLFSIALPLLRSVTTSPSPGRRATLDEGHDFVVGWHEVGAAVLRDDDGAAGISQARSPYANPSRGCTRTGSRLRKRRPRQGCCGSRRDSRARP